MQSLFPQKASYRGDAIASGLGFVERFNNFLSSILKKTLLDPLTAVTANPDSPTGIGSKLNNILEKFATLRKFLDEQDQQMVTAVAQAWTQDQQLLSQAASSASSVMKQSETTGTSLVNQEMSQMYQAANNQARNNDRDIARLAKMEIQSSNSTVKSVTQQAQKLYRAANATIAKTDTLYNNMNATLAALQNTITQTTLGLSQVQNSVSQSGSSMFVRGQSDTSNSQNQAGSSVDQSLKAIATSVSQALSALTSQQTRDLAGVTNALTQNLNQLSQKISGMQSNLQSSLSQLQNTADNNFTSTMGTASSNFQKVSDTLTNSNNSLIAANTSFTSLKSGMQSQFAALDSQLQQSFAAQTQQAQLTEANLESYMQSALNQFTADALAETSSSSGQLSSAYESALAQAQGGSGALKLTNSQKQALIARLQGWQKDYAGNTNSLASALTSTYGGLVTDTKSHLQDAIDLTSKQLADASDSQMALVENAVSSVQGGPSPVDAVAPHLQQIGLRAQAAAKEMNGSLSTAVTGYAAGMADATDALKDLEDAAGDASQTYDQANILNGNATKVAQEAVYNTTRRIGLMNTLMEQYSSELASQIFNASNAAEQAANNAGNNASGAATANIQAKMAQVQAALASALAKGQTSASQLSTFAASVKANATMLSDLASAVQSDSSDAISKIVQAKSEAVDQLKVQVASQLKSVTDTFDSQTAEEKKKLASLVKGMQDDLASQSGAKAQLLVQSQTQLQSLYGSMSTSQAARSQAQKRLDDSFTDALGNATIRMAELTREIAAQKSAVSSQITDLQQKLNAAQTQVNGTISDANSSARGELASLQSQGDTQVAAVRQAIADVSATVDLMVNRFEAVISRNMDTDTQQRIDENTRELGMLMGLNSTLDSSKSAQASGITQTAASQVARAQNLASIIANLSGAGLAAQNGSDAFQAYVVALANQTGVNMGDLVNAMKAQAADQKSDLYNLLQKNNLFVNDTLGSLAAASAGLQSGVVTGAGAAMAQIQASMNKSNKMFSGEKARMGGLTNDAGAVVGISSQQLVQLMTILTSQNAVQQSAAYQANQAAFKRIAGVADALSISTKAMYQASNATQDAIQVAEKASDDVEARVTALVKGTIAAATNQESTYLTQAATDYAAIMKALNSAEGFTPVYQNKLQTIQDDIQSGESEIEASIGKLKSKISELQTTIETNTQNDLTQLNNWAQQAGPSALDMLSKIQAAASSRPAPKR